MARHPANSDEPRVESIVRHHVAFAWIIVSLLAVFAFAYAINLPVH